MGSSRGCELALGFVAAFGSLGPALVGIGACGLGRGERCRSSGGLRFGLVARSCLVAAVTQRGKMLGDYLARQLAA
jgi:hypothetical protein